MFEPGKKELVSKHHAALVEALLVELPERFPEITPEEHAILSMSVDLLDYLYDYATGPTNEEFSALSEEEKKALPNKRRENRRNMTVSEYRDVLICYRGIELLCGRLVPKS